MTASYTNYTDIALNAFKFNVKQQDAIHRKYEILESIGHHYHQSPASVLFYGFNPWILAGHYKNILITDISESAKKFISDLGIKYTYIDSNDLGNYSRSFDWVVTADEYFTFASVEEEQRAKVENLVGLAKKLVITTLRDYKNQDFKDREYSQPAIIKSNNQLTAFTEIHD